MSVKLLKAGKHTCLGALQGDITIEGDSEQMLDRPCMLVYVGKFDSMDGPVEITEQHIDLLVKTHSTAFAHLKRMIGSEDIPVRMCPPLQVDHSASAMMTVGRVVGRLHKGVYAHPVLGDVVALFADRVRVLGKENVEKVRDGRWADVSIGADLETGKLNELSITPFPAAMGATLLSKESNQENSMEDKLKKHLMEHRKLSDKDADDLSKKMREHHMKHMSMDEEKMSKHLADAKDDELKRMSEEYDKHLKHLAEKESAQGGESAGVPEEKEKKMSAAREGLVRLAKGITVQSKAITGEIRMASVSGRIARLRSLGKLTPAEVKKIDLVKLASMTEKECEAALSAFDIMEPRVNFGAVSGSTKAEAIQKVASKYKLARLELETRMNMPSKREEARVQMSKLAEEEKKELSQVSGGEEPSKGMLTKVGYDELCKMLEDKDRHEELRTHLKHLVDIHGDEPSEGDGKRMSAIAKQQAELQNSFNELVSVVAPAFGIKPEELNQ
jgi:hypothetical protein